MPRMPKPRPNHPGAYLWHAIIVPSGLNLLETASMLGVSRVMLSSILNGHEGVSAEMARRFELVFGDALGVRMETLLAMQAAYDAARARSEAKPLTVRRFEPAMASAA
jgi:antitoxin HigA-1